MQGQNDKSISIQNMEDNNECTPLLDSQNCRIELILQKLPE